MAIYVKDGIKCQKREDFNSNIEFLSVELDIKYVKPIIVTTIYRPPESKGEWFKQAEELISRIDIEGKESILAGDMNCDLLKPRDNDTKHINPFHAAVEKSRQCGTSSSHGGQENSTQKHQPVSKGISWEPRIVLQHLRR